MAAWRCVVVSLALLAAASARAELSALEQRIVDAVKARVPAALQLLERSVRISSSSLDPEGVQAVGRLLRNELDALGFATRWVDMPAAMKRGGHLLAERPGDRGQRLLLLGHLDTVFDQASAQSDWEQRGQRVRGPGVNDMKGGNVVLIEALHALQAVGALEGARIAVLLTGDEERVGQPVAVSRAELREQARRSDAALSFEGASRIGGDDFASIARRSGAGWVLQVRARPGHSSGVGSSSRGFGAVYEAARILDAFRQQVFEPGLTLNPGLIAGGTTVELDADTASASARGRNNIIAAGVQVRGDLRYLSPEQGERARQRMREIVAAHLSGASASIEFSETYPPMPATEGSHRLLEAYSRASQDAGLGPVREADASTRGAGDIQFTAPFVPGLDGLGVLGRGAHTPDEDMDIASLERGAIRAALLIHRLTRP